MTNDWRIGNVWRCWYCKQPRFELSTAYAAVLKGAESQDELLKLAQGFHVMWYGVVPDGPPCHACAYAARVACVMQED